MTKATKDGYKLGRFYLHLLEQFPLMKIRDDREYDRATAVLQALIGRNNLNEDENRYLDALIVLVKTYDEKTYDFDEDISPIAALKLLLRANEMSTADLGRVIGSSSYATMVLKGDRSISKEMAKKLAERFRVDAGIFL